MRTERRADLGVTGFEADRSAEAVGEQRLHRDQDAAAKGDAAAIERVGFDSGGQLLCLQPTGGDQSDDREQQSAKRRDQQRPLPRNNAGSAETSIEGNIEQQRMRDFAEMRDRRNQQAAEQADHNRYSDQTGFEVADKIAQD